MYEEKTKKKVNIDWKSLIIKIVILLVVVFIILWVISLFKGDKKKVESNLTSNLQYMQKTAKEYFTGSKLPTNVNGRRKITLGEMIEKNVIIEFKDQNNKACDMIDSYAEATKVNNTDYTIKVKLVCGGESDYIIDTIKYEDDNSNIGDNNVSEPVGDNGENNDNSQVDNTVNNNKPSTSKPNNNSSANKPSTVTKPSTSKPNNSVVNVCTYGNKDYSSNYPLAYVIPGDCAINSNYTTYSKNIMDIMGVEYNKIYKEMLNLANSSGASLDLSNKSIKVYNKANTGLVGYQALFTIKNKDNGKVIYEYYLNTDGTRKVTTDLRSSLTVRVSSIILSKTAIDLDVNKSYILTATINPSGASGKKITWSSSNNNVASVDSNGKISAKREGTAFITAEVDGKSASAKVNVYKEASSIYCKTREERVYSTGYISANNIKSNYSYRVALKTNYLNVYSVKASNLNAGNEYSSAYRYLMNKNKPLSLVGSNNTNALDPGSYSNLIKYSLKAYNFTPTVKYSSRAGNTLYFDINLKMKNLNNIKYAEAFTYNNYGIYYTPLYFDIITYDEDNCRSVGNSEVEYYKNLGYVKYN